VYFSYQSLRRAELVNTHEQTYEAPEMMRDEYFQVARNELYNSVSDLYIRILEVMH